MLENIDSKKFECPPIIEHLCQVLGSMPRNAPLSRDYLSACLGRGVGGRWRCCHPTVEESPLCDSELRSRL